MDPDTSGAKPIEDRRAGRALCLRVMPGDMILCLAFDRLFRSLVNGVAQLNGWANRDIGVYSVRDRREFSHRDREGQLFVYFMSLIAQWERHFISVRCCEAKAIAKKNGLVYSPKIPPGYILIGAKGNRKKVVDWNQQRTIDLIVEWRDAGMKWDDIVKRLRVEGHRYDFVKARNAAGGYVHEKREWTRPRCFRSYHLRKKGGRPPDDAQGINA